MTGIAVGASMIIPGFGQLYANAVVLGVISGAARRARPTATPVAAEVQNDVC